MPCGFAHFSSSLVEKLNTCNLQKFYSSFTKRTCCDAEKRTPSLSCHCLPLFVPTDKTEVVWCLHARVGESEFCQDHQFSMWFVKPCPLCQLPPHMHVLLHMHSFSFATSCSVTQLDLCPFVFSAGIPADFQLVLSFVFFLI